MFLEHATKSQSGLNFKNFYQEIKLTMDYKEEQAGEIEALLSIYEGELDGGSQFSLWTNSSPADF